MSRINHALLALSASALVGIAVHEGYRGEAYEPVKGDVPTIGFGTTEGVEMGDRTTPERALILLLRTLTSFKMLSSDVPRSLCINMNSTPTFH